MSQARGLATWSLDGKVVREMDTLTCAHCNAPFHMPPKPHPPAGSFCRLCMQAICDGCTGKECRPFMKTVEKMESTAVARAQRERLLKAAGI